MIKIMLVEDDKSLREIYGVRLLAEGYDIVSAGDGEEALAMAIKERPKLIISDVMMPKISGFDMLDILRSTTETKDIQVIMMTALSSEEQRQRGETLGADRYLVKSQVGIEDVVRVVHEVLGDQPGSEGSAPKPPSATPPSTPPAAPPSSPPPAPTPPPATPSAAAPATPRPAAAAIPTPTPIVPSGQTPTADAPVAPVTPATPPVEPPKPASIKTRVITPLNDPSTSPVDINELLSKELAKEAGISEDARPAVATTDQEKAIVSEQLNQFATAPAEEAPAEDGDKVAEINISEDGDLSTDEAEKPAEGVPPPPPPPPSPTA